MICKKKNQCDKLSFTKIEAESALKRARKSSKNYRKEIRCYYCHVHGAWHLTSKEDEETLDIKIKYTKKWKRVLKKSKI